MPFVYTILKEDMIKKILEQYMSEKLEEKLKIHIGKDNKKIWAKVYQED